MSIVKIAGRNAGEDNPVLIIAEAGINHDGKYEQALQLVDVASEAGADIVKFQLFKSEKMYSKTAGYYNTADGGKIEITEALKKTELPVEWLDSLMSYCEKKKIGFLCTVCDEEGADILNEHGVDAYKLASYGITHLPLLKHVAKKGKTVVFSTGAALLTDIEKALRTITDTGNNHIAIMHCIAKYPAPLESCNMNVMDTLQFAFPDVVIGYSDHTEDPLLAPVTAVYKGAKIIEKHFTIDKNLPGPDHSFAVDPVQLRQMVSAIREAEENLKKGNIPELQKTILGTSRKMILPIEEYLRKYAFRCIVAKSDIKEGEIISIENTAILRPGENERGIEPEFYEMLLNLNVKAKRDIVSGNSVKWEDVL